MCALPFNVNRQTQVGPEVTAGTGVAATKLFSTLTVDPDPDFDVTKIRGTGRRFHSIIIPSGQEGTTGKIGGGLTYTEFMYPASMIWGAADIDAVAGGISAYQHVWKPPLSGTVSPKSMTLEQGDSDDAERFVYCVLTAIGLDMSRANANITGSLLARAVEKAGDGTWTGMTESPTGLALMAVIPSKWDVYLDDVYGSVGTTKLTTCYKATFDYGGAFIPYYPMDSTLTSFAGLADGEDVAATMALTLVKDATLESALWAAARAGSIRYIGVKAQGDIIDNIHNLAIGTGTPTSGTFKLTYKGVEMSTGVSYDCTSAALETALGALSTVGAANVTCTGGPLPTTAIKIQFTDALAQDTSAITVTAQPSGGTYAVTAAPIRYSIELDAAVRVIKPGGTAAEQGLRTRQWDFQIVEDSAWDSGTALKVKLVNALSSL